MAHSNDLRIRIVEAYENKEGSIRALSLRFKVGINTVNDYIKRYLETGSVDKSPHGGGKRPHLAESDGYDKLKQLYQEDNTRTDQEYRDLLQERFEINVSRHVVNRAFAKLGITKKK